MKIGFCSALFLVLLVLKLTHTIDWSWWWISAPLWGDFILSVIAGVINTQAEAAKKKVEEEYNRSHPGRRSKFMDKLDEAMKASEDRRNEELAKRKQKHDLN